MARCLLVHPFSSKISIQVGGFHGHRGALGAPGRAHPREALHDRRHPLRHLRLGDVRLPAHHHGTYTHWSNALDPC